MFKDIKSCRWFWVGFKHSSGDFRTWINVVTGQVQDNLPWDFGQPNGRQFQDCAKARFNPKNTPPGYVVDVECSRVECFGCQLSTSSTFHLRGLTDDLAALGIDREYSISLTKDNQMGTQEFLGFQHSKIVWDQDQLTFIHSLFWRWQCKDSWPSQTTNPIWKARLVCRWKVCGTEADWCKLGERMAIQRVSIQN